MNDSLRTDIFLRFTPETISCACIDLAARALQVNETTAIKMTLSFISLRFHCRETHPGM